MKVFGIGLSKTGTMSLTAALNKLGIKTVHFPMDFLTYRELFSGQFRLSIMDQYDGCVEGIAPWFPQLDEAFPDSKFVLTVRSKKSWMNSIRFHLSMFNDFERYERKRRVGKPYNAMTSLYHTAAFGCVFFNESRFSYAYDMHKRNVMEYFEGSKKLLIMDICAGDGWNKLCPFLEEPVIEGDFHHENETPYSKNFL